MPPADTAASPMIAGGAMAQATIRLRAAGSPTARLDAEVLSAHAFGRDRAWLLAHLDEPLTDAVAGNLAASLDRRASGEPIAYIRGFKEWYGLRIQTDRRALIPRPETELLVDRAIEAISGRLAADDRPILVRDVGTGSGAVAVAIGSRFRSALTLGRVRLVATDTSADALALAAANLDDHGLAGLVTLGQADLLDPLWPGDAPPDVVVANLPYVGSGEVASRAGSLAWEPTGALDGGADGLDVVRRLLISLGERLAGDGIALLEIGAGQARAVREAAAGIDRPWHVTTALDLSGHERVVRLERSAG